MCICHRAFGSESEMLSTLFRNANSSLGVSQLALLFKDIFFLGSHPRRNPGTDPTRAHAGALGTWPWRGSWVVYVTILISIGVDIHKTKPRYSTNRVAPRMFCWVRSLVQSCAAVYVCSIYSSRSMYVLWLTL